MTCDCASERQAACPNSSAPPGVRMRSSSDAQGRRGMSSKLVPRSGPDEEGAPACSGTCSTPAGRTEALKASSNMHRSIQQRAATGAVQHCGADHNTQSVDAETSHYTCGPCPSALPQDPPPPANLECPLVEHIVLYAPAHGLAARLGVQEQPQQRKAHHAQHAAGALNGLHLEPAPAADRRCGLVARWGW